MFDKLKYQLIVYLTLVSLIPLLFLGTYCYFTINAAFHEHSLKEFASITAYETSRIRFFLAEIQKEMLLISHSRTFAAMLKTLDSKVFERNKKYLQKEFLALLKNKKYYFQLRYIDENGIEVFRVDSEGLESTDDKIQKAQNKHTHSYFKNVFNLPRGQFFVSKLALKRQQGKIEKPLKPIIYCGTPVFCDGKKEGIILATIFADSFLSPGKYHNERHAYNILISHDGYYFSHPDEGREWGDANDLATMHNVQDDFPQEIAEFLLNSRNGEKSFDNYIVAQSVYFPDSTKKNGYWKLARIGSTELILAPVSRFIIFLAVSLAVALFLAIYAYMAINKRFTKPIIRMTEAVNEISKGKVETILNVEGGYEVRILAEGIRKVANSLKILIRKIKS